MVVFFPPDGAVAGPDSCFGSPCQTTAQPSRPLSNDRFRLVLIDRDPCPSSRGRGTLAGLNAESERVARISRIVSRNLRPV